MKKIVIFMLSFFMLFTNVCFGNALIDNYYSDGAFKFSEKEEGKLPYLAISGDRMIVDRDVNKSGMMISGKNIDIDNIMKNNQLIISGDTVRINKDVENAIVFAPKVIINGNVKHLYTITESLNITEKGVVSEDVIVFSEMLNIMGTVNGSVIGNVFDIDITGKVLNDLRVYTDKLNIENASINGKVLIKSFEDITIPNKFENKEFIKLKKNENKLNINVISIILTYILVGIIYYLMNRKDSKIDNMLNNFKQNLSKIILSGTLIIMLAPLVFLISLYMIILGIHVVPTVLLTLLFGFMILGFTLSSFLIALLLDNKIFMKYENMYQNNINKVITIIVTSIVINLTIYIPILGGILSMIYGIISIGILYTNMFNKNLVKECD